MQSIFSNTIPAKEFSVELTTKTREYTKLILALKKKNDYSLHEASLFVPADISYQKTIASQLKSFKKVKHVVLVGIGGSSLGTEAVYHALKTEKSPTLHVVDSVDPASLTAVKSLVGSISNASDIAVVVISKSGNTTETIFNATTIVELLEKKFKTEAYTRIIGVGNPDTLFMSTLQGKGILTIPMPEIVGGRYSVFTAVGIVPLTLLGIDVARLCKGAEEALSTSGIKQIEKRALTIAQHAKTGTHTINFFTFSKRLTLLGYWYRQLLAESVGKNITTNNAPFTNALNPVVTTSADLHSIAELYLGGYKGIFTRFISLEKDVTVSLPKKHWMTQILPILSEKNSSTVTSAIFEGVTKAYKEQQLPFESIKLPEANAYTVGAMMSVLMAETMYLGYLFEINPFIQPSVELYKKHTRTNLQK